MQKCLHTRERLLIVTPVQTLFQWTCLKKALVEAEVFAYKREAAWLWLRCRHFFNGPVWIKLWLAQKCLRAAFLFVGLLLGQVQYCGWTRPENKANYDTMARTQFIFWIIFPPWSGSNIFLHAACKQKVAGSCSKSVAAVQFGTGDAVQLLQISCYNTVWYSCYKSVAAVQFGTGDAVQLLQISCCNIVWNNCSKSVAAVQLLQVSLEQVMQCSCYKSVATTQFGTVAPNHLLQCSLEQVMQCSCYKSVATTQFGTVAPDQLLQCSLEQVIQCSCYKSAATTQFGTVAPNQLLQCSCYKSVWNK